MEDWKIVEMRSALGDLLVKIGRGMIDRMIRNAWRRVVYRVNPE